MLTIDLQYDENMTINMSCKYNGNHLILQVILLFHIYFLSFFFFSSPPTVFEEVSVLFGSLFCNFPHSQKKLLTSLPSLLKKNKKKNIGRNSLQSTNNYNNSIISRDNQVNKCRKSLR